MDKILCECGHSITGHGWAETGCEYCKCSLSPDTVEARHIARRMMNERNKIELEYIGEVARGYDLELCIDKAKDELRKQLDTMTIVYKDAIAEATHLRAKLDDAVEVLKRVRHNVNHYKHGECLGCMAEGILNRIGEQK